MWKLGNWLIGKYQTYQLIFRIIEIEFREFKRPS